MNSFYRLSFLSSDGLAFDVIDKLLLNIFSINQEKESNKNNNKIFELQEIYFQSIVQTSRTDILNSLFLFVY
jgi:hypothetical protein